MSLYYWLIDLLIEEFAYPFKKKKNDERYAKPAPLFIPKR